MLGLYLLQLVLGPSLILGSFHFEFGSLLDLEKKNDDNNLKRNFACSLKPQDYGSKTLNEVANMAKRLGRVGSIGLADQTGHKSKHVIFKWVNWVTGQVGFTYIFQTIFYFLFFYNYKNKSMTTCLERMNKIN